MDEKVQMTQTHKNLIKKFPSSKKKMVFELNTWRWLGK